MLSIKPTVPVYIKKCSSDPSLPYPIYQSDEASGFDIHIPIDLTIDPNSYKVFGCGFQVKIPDFLELQLRPRSGLSCKTSYLFKNTIGTIDSDYTGELCVCIYNLSTHDPLILKKYDRICQGVLVPVYRANFVQVEELPDTERGSGGLNSSGGVHILECDNQKKI
jgi:dUTP pyrophosphatase